MQLNIKSKSSKANKPYSYFVAGTSKLANLFNMKSLLATPLLIVLGILAVFTASCGKDALEPEVQFTADKTTVAVNGEVTFSVAGQADGFAIYTGDDLHKYENSYQVITNGKDIETEIVYLTAAKFQELKLANVIKVAAIQDSVEKMIGVKYKGLSHPTFLITLFYDYAVAVADVNKITAYFTLENASQVPVGGFSTGVAIDASVKNKTFKYKYTKAGVYVATLLTTNMGRKQYGKGKNPGLTTADDYDKQFTTKTVTITVN